MSFIDLKAYRDTYRQLVEAVADIGEAQLKWKETQAKWSINEVLAHLTDHHLVVSFRIRDLLADTTARLPAFDQDKWVAGQRANECRTADILQAFSALLQYNGLLFERLSPADFEKSGINAKGEKVRVSDIIAGFIKHVTHHLAQIDRIKSAYAQRSLAHQEVN